MSTPDRCGTCQFFDTDEQGWDDIVPTRYDDEYDEYERRVRERNEPFAQCLRPAFFVTLKEQDDVSDVRMIVADGSGYKASLYVHRDHYCAEWRPSNT